MVRAQDLTIKVERRSIHIAASDGPVSADVFAINDTTGDESKLIRVYRVELDLDRNSAQAKVTYVRPGHTGMQTEYIALDEFDLRFSGLVGKTLGLPNGVKPDPGQPSVVMNELTLAEMVRLTDDSKRGSDFARDMARGILHKDMS